MFLTTIWNQREARQALMRHLDIATTLCLDCVVQNARAQPRLQWAGDWDGAKETDKRQEACAKTRVGLADCFLDVSDEAWLLSQLE